MSLRIAFFGSSLLSAYWNGAATYYRGIIRALAERGHRIRFYEPDAFQRQSHKDIEEPEWAQVVVYSGTDSSEAQTWVKEASQWADVLIKTSGVGVFDELLEKAVLEARRPGQIVLFWDVDAPATLDRVINNPSDPFRKLIAQYDMILTYGGGKPVIQAYRSLGAKDCVPIYNALDPQTHHRARTEERFTADLGLMANRLPDREQRIEEYFFRPAQLCPRRLFVLGGNGWHDKPLGANMRWVGHLYTAEHNAFNSSVLTVLNVARDSMAKTGYSPATRVFEAAGAGACIITDEWEGIETFLEPGQEILVARDGAQVAAILQQLSSERARQIGQAAQKRVLSLHTYTHRAKEVESLWQERVLWDNRVSL